MIISRHHKYEGEGFGSLSCLLVLEMKMIFRSSLKQKRFTTNGQKLYDFVQ